MRAIVHFGLHKTGTTSIQAYLANNRALLTRLGIHYPPDLFPGGLAHHRLACSLGEPDEPENDHLFFPERQLYCARGCAPTPAQTTQSALADFFEQIREYDTVLLSSEIFSTYAPREVQRLIDFLDRPMTALIYLRDGIRFLYACWATKVRWGSTRSFSSFVKESLTLDRGSPFETTFRLVHALESLDGVDLSIRSYDKAVARDGILSDLSEEVLGIRTDQWGGHSERHNRTPSAVELELMRQVNLILAGLGIAWQDRAATAARLLAKDELKGPFSHASRLIEENLEPVTLPNSVARRERMRFIDSVVTRHPVRENRLYDWALAEQGSAMELPARVSGDSISRPFAALMVSVLKEDGALPSEPPA